MANLQYIGARYVPKFFTNPDDQSNDWKAGELYEALTIVTYNNDSYTSKVVVPENIGDPASNPNYWACTTKYTAALMALQTTVGNIGTLLGNSPLDTQSQTVTAAINELAKLKVIITPEMYGAVGDGVTDDTAAINAMLADAPGKIVLFVNKYAVNGTYTNNSFYDTGLQVQSDTVIRFASGSELIQLAADTETASIFTLLGVHNVDIGYGTIIGDYDIHVDQAGSTNEWCHGFTIYGCSNIHIHDMTIKKCYGDGIYVGQFPYYGGPRPANNHCANVIIENVIIDKAGRNGISIGDCDGWTLQNLTITNVNRTNPKSAIDIEQEGNYTPFVSNGLIKNLVTSGCHESIEVVYLTDSIVTLENIKGDPINTANNTLASGDYQIIIKNAEAEIQIWQTKVQILDSLITELSAPRETGLDSESFEMINCKILHTDNYLAIKNNFRAINCEFQSSIIVSGASVYMQNCVFDFENANDHAYVITLAGSVIKDCQVIDCVFKNIIASTVYAIRDAAGAAHKLVVRGCKCETALNASLDNSTYFAYCTGYDIVADGNSYYPFAHDALTAHLVSGCVNFDY